MNEIRTHRHTSDTCSDFTVVVTSLDEVRNPLMLAVVLTVKNSIVSNSAGDMSMYFSFPVVTNLTCLTHCLRSTVAPRHCVVTYVDS